MKENSLADASADSARTVNAYQHPASDLLAASCAAANASKLTYSDTCIFFALQPALAPYLDVRIKAQPL